MEDKVIFSDNKKVFDVFFPKECDLDKITNVKIREKEFVNVVRCKDCKHSKLMSEWIRWCTYHDIKCAPLIMDDWFSADGERKEK